MLDVTVTVSLETVGPSGIVNVPLYCGPEYGSVSAAPTYALGTSGGIVLGPDELLPQATVRAHNARALAREINER